MGEPRSRTIDGYRFTSEQVCERVIGVKSTRLEELARSGHAPCRISESGEIHFKINEITPWIKENLFTYQQGTKVPFTIHVYSDGSSVPEKPIPREISDVQGLREFPHSHFPPCVYFLIKEEKVVYVGQSVGLPGRIGAHQSGKDYDRVLFLPVPLSDLTRVEREFIKSLNPPLNGKSIGYTSTLKRV